jgi:uncharacterized protein
MSLSLPMLIVVQQILVFAPPFLIYLAITKEDFEEVVLTKRLGIVNTTFVILLTLLAIPFMMLLSGVTSMFFPNTTSDMVLHLTLYPLLASILAVALTPTIFEELVFRGLVFSNYKHVDIKKGAFVTGLFFGIMHLNPQQFFYAFVFGILMTYFVYYTKSIYAGMVSHFTVNAFNLLLMYQLSGNHNPNATQPLPPNTASLILSFLVMFVILSPLIAIFYILYKIFIKINIAQNSKDINDDTKEIQHEPKDLKIVDNFFIATIILFIFHVVLFSL